MQQAAAGVFIKYGNSIGINLTNTQIPSELVLGQNYPNPFNPETKINFSIPKSSEVSMKVFDQTGKEITTLVNEFKSAGNYTVDFKAGSNLSSGIYFYIMRAGEFTMTKKFMLIK